MKIIGLDLGSKTLGIAISDSQMIVATGVDNFHFPENKLEFAVEKIKKVIEEYDDVGEIVLGHPLLMNGQKSKMTLFCEDFYKILKKNFKTLKIILWDESFTTKNTISNLKDSGIKMSKIKKIKDKVSAVLLLDDYLQNKF